MNDVYKTPQSNLSEPSSGPKGSIQKGLNGDYNIDIGGMLREAWAKTEGAKLTLFLAAVVVGVITQIATFIAQLILSVVITPDSQTNVLLVQFLGGLLILPVSQPLYAGMLMLGIRRSQGLPIDFSTVFNYFSKMTPLLILGVLMTILISIGFLLLIIPGIYLAIAYTLAMPLVIEKNMSPWEAMETSRKAITKKWFLVFGLLFVMALIMIVSALPLLVGLFWTIPMMLILMGMLYHTVFGVDITE